MPPTDPPPRTGEAMHQPPQPPSSGRETARRDGDRVGGTPKEGTGGGPTQADAAKTDPVTGAGEDIAG